MPDIAANLQAVRDRIARACDRAGRPATDVTLVAVTKTVTPVEVAELYRLGVRDFGENRVADGLARKDALNAPDARWHMIGHLQRNKAAAALAGGFTRIHSVESDKLVEVLEREAAKQDITVDILLEVNVSGEESKYGTDADRVRDLAAVAARQPHLRLNGLMTMAPFTDDPETARPYFRQLAALRDDLADRLGRPLPVLSMGMTGDFEVAVEEGATHVRVGTALFR
ncbi:MAG: YggS family pyridoxal phosphate-dependent enzyme [Planctomycetes bacterium]|nr:YggS family pyridoxal phosphate-dependent enzyme [Planctomycetota bacterium]MCD7897558.1 YggS family pyridoxal phosphate-dependent enzyme [Planctomycetaceae bacterium]